jgi:hypothetical protein
MLIQFQVTLTLNLYVEEEFESEEEDSILAIMCCFTLYNIYLLIVKSEFCTCTLFITVVSCIW